MARGLPYLVIFIVTAALATYGSIIVHKAFAVGICNQTGYAPTRFMGFCGSDKIGSYEHAAFYHNLEPDMTRHLQAADVLVLGNSRALYGFSTQAVHDYFAARGLKYFVMAFGYSEKSGFALAIIKRYQLKPKMMIINADPFFFHHISATGVDAMREDIGNRLMVYAKKWGQNISRRTCPVFGCVERAGSIFRDRVNGRWFWRDTLISDKAVGPFDPAAMKNVDNYFPHEKSVAAGKAFIAAVPVRPDCMILTAVPTPQGNFQHVAEILGPPLGLPTVNTVVPNLMTVDGEHLNTDSSERWSRSVIEAMDPYIRRCTGH